MNKSDLIKWFDELLLPKGYKRKGNTWKHSGEYLSKVINLQRSMYGAFYYVNYGFNINGLETKELFLHVFLRVASDNKKEQEYIMNLFDLESDLPVQKRERGIRNILLNVIQQTEQINTKNDLVGFIEKSSLANISWIVKVHLGMDSWGVC